MTFTVVIPARFSSTRLPGKPLQDIAGKSMIQRVYEQARQSSADRVIVATDHQQIADEVTRFGGEVCMTSPDHPSGTDRLQEVVAQHGFAEDHVLVNVQGDEPLIPPAVIEQVAANLINNTVAGIATLCEPITDEARFNNPNVVKVVTDHQGMSLYFSRAPVPWPRDFSDDRVAAMSAILQPMRHIGIYAYRVGLLNRFVQWPVAPIEALECLEQLRFMWNGERIHVARAVADVPGGVDTEQDLQRVVAIFRGMSE